jgi:hypothetical protein
MLKLPKIPYNMEKNKQQTVSMGNINYSKMTRDGDIADSSGISGRYFPYITTANGCSEAIGEVKDCESATLFDEKWAQVDTSGALYYDGQLVGQLTPGEKQFAAINTKLVIMPDKKYLDISGEVPELKDMGAKVEVDAVFNKNYILNFSSEYSILGYANGNTFTAAVPEEGLDCTGGDYRLLISGTIIKVLKYMCSFSVKECVTTDEMRYYRVYASEDQCSVLKELRPLLTSGEGASVVVQIANSDNYGDVTKYSWEVLWDKDANGQDAPDKPYAPGYYRLCDNGDYRSLPQVEGNFEINLFVWLPQKNYTVVCTNNGPTCRLVIPDKGVDRLIRVYCEMLNGIDYMRVTSRDLPEGIFEGKIYNGADVEVDFAEMLRDCTKIMYSFSEVSSATYSKEVGIQAVHNNAFWTQEDIVSGIGLGEYGYMHIKFCRDKVVQVFKKGDAVTISGASDEKNNITFVIDSITPDGNQIYAKSDVFEALPEKAERVSIERRIPDLDYICEHDNRIYGCSNTDNTIYASALGDPTNIYAYQGISTDSFSVAVASEGPFTGCYPYDGGVMFWKSDKLHKLLGSYPAEYALYTFNIDGVQQGSHKSLQNINEVLYYKGNRGVFAFDGSPRLISENFGDRHFSSAVGGNDGECYYVSMVDEDKRAHLFSYNTRTGLWVREGESAITGFARSGKDMYIVEGGEIKLYGAEKTPTDAEWYVQFTPIYETIEGQKTYSRIKLRVELPQGSYMIISMRCDGGRWSECGKVIGKREGIVPVMIPVNRCDKFELKIEGKGTCVIHSILREFCVGGDR